MKKYLFAALAIVSLSGFAVAAEPEIKCWNSSGNWEGAATQSCEVRVGGGALTLVTCKDGSVVQAKGETPSCPSCGKRGKKA